MANGFIDKARITVRAGNGGNTAAAAALLPLYLLCPPLGGGKTFIRCTHR